MFPRPVLTLTAVVMFGPWLGLFYAMSGVLLAALTHYYAGRMFIPLLLFFAPLRDLRAFVVRL